MVLESNSISVTTFPQEWTFSMLKDAAIAVLQVNIISAKFGYQTFDCHGFNILFDGCNPKFIDLGSFVKIKDPNRNWAAYDEFIRCYYHVLLIWSKGKFYLASRILSDNNWKRFSPYDDYYLEESGLKVNRQLTLGELSDKIDQFKANKVNKGNDTARNNQPDFSTFRIIELLKKYGVRSITDLSRDRGIITKLLLQESTINKVIYVNNDEDSADALYNSMKSDPNGKLKLNIFLMNILSTIDNFGSRSAYSRVRSDAVIAVSLVHRLLLDETPIDVILRAIAKCTSKYAFIDFYTFGHFLPIAFIDDINQPSLPTWCSIEWFKEHLSAHFKIILEEILDLNQILFVCEIIDAPQGERELVSIGDGLMEHSASLENADSLENLSGFHQFENTSGTPIRWMKADATIHVCSLENCLAVLRLKATSFRRNRTLEIYAEDELLKRVEIPTEGLIEFTTPVCLVEGINAFRFRVPEGCERPCNKPELKSSDERCLSVAIQNMTLAKRKFGQVDCLSGFHDIENWSGTPTRWMQSEVTFLISSPEERTANLSLQALSFYRPRTLEVYSGGKPAARVDVPTSFINVGVPLHLAKGENIVRLHVPEGCERPSDKPELNNPDSRFLSLAVQNLKVI